MRNGKKIAFSIIIFIAIVALGYAYYVWNKPARDVREETGIQISAVAIFASVTRSNIKTITGKYFFIMFLCE